MLKARVSGEGECLGVEVKHSSGYAVLDEAALEAVKRWQFQPATLNGTPLEGEIEIPIRFKLVD